MTFNKLNLSGQIFPGGDVLQKAVRLPASQVGKKFRKMRYILKVVPKFPSCSGGFLPSERTSERLKGRNHSQRDISLTRRFLSAGPY